MSRNHDILSFALPALVFAFLVLALVLCIVAATGCQPQDDARWYNEEGMLKHGVFTPFLLHGEIPAENRGKWDPNRCMGEPPVRLLDANGPPYGEYPWQALGVDCGRTERPGGVLPSSQPASQPAAKPDDKASCG